MNELNILIAGLNLFGPPQSLETLGRELQLLLEASTGGVVRVVTEDIRRSGSTVLGMKGQCTNLFTWHFWPYPDLAERDRRWAKLRGEAGTQWDWIILAENPETLLHLPGFHAAAVAAIQHELRGSPSRLLLLVPPAPDATPEERQQILRTVMRVAHSAGIAAATAPDLVRALTDPEYPLPEAHPIPSTQNPFAVLGDSRAHIDFSHKGTSTERDLTAAVHAAFATLNRSANSERFTGTYNSNTPLDDGLGWPADAALPIAFNLGRHPDFVDDGYKGYVTNPDVWQLGFAFAYQFFTSEHPLDDANAHFLAMIEPLDLAVARKLRGEGTARAVPLRALWALIHREYPGERYQRDRVHLNRGLLKAAGVFMVTLYTGESPVQTVSTDPAFAGREDYDLFCQRTGYELARQLATVQIHPPLTP